MFWAKRDVRHFASYFTELSLIEIARLFRIPVSFHVLKTVYDDETVRKLDAYFYIYKFDATSNRFHRIVNDQETESRLTIAVQNIWYEGSDPNRNYGAGFLETRFLLEEYFKTWRGHRRMKSLFRQDHQSCELDLPGCLEYFEFMKRSRTEKELEKIKSLSFMFVCDVYASTVSVESKWSRKIKDVNWNAVRIKASSGRNLETKLHNRWYWEEAKCNDALICVTSEIRFNSMLNSLAEKIARNYFSDAKAKRRIDVAELDPLVGDTSCQVRATVIACFRFLGRFYH